MGLEKWAWVNGWLSRLGHADINFITVSIPRRIMVQIKWSINDYVMVDLIWTVQVISHYEPQIPWNTVRKQIWDWFEIMLWCGPGKTHKITRIWKFLHPTSRYYPKFLNSRSRMSICTLYQIGMCHYVWKGWIPRPIWQDHAYVGFSIRLPEQVSKTHHLTKSTGLKDGRHGFDIVRFCFPAQEWSYLWGTPFSYAPV